MSAPNIEALVAGEQSLEDGLLDELVNTFPGFRCELSTARNRHLALTLTRTWLLVAEARAVRKSGQLTAKTIRAAFGADPA